jgi:UDP-N-acetylglucosamine 2-epimerase (non-hydrolysing)
LIKVLTIFGTRPEAVKLAPVILKLQKAAGFESVTCVTAQHRELLDQVNQLFGIKPDFDLDLMRENQSLSELTARVFNMLPEVLARVQPDWVLVQGDTTTVMSAALAAYYHRIKVGHVEAGLRTFDKWQPFPEEINRKVAGAVADLHFAPTPQSRANLLAEGVPAYRIIVSGNPIIDALQMVAQQPFDLQSSPLAGIPFDKRIVLVTAHRRENFGAPLQSVCEAIRTLAADPDLGLHFVYPVHPNPNVVDTVRPILAGHPNISLLPPVDYHSLIYLMANADLVLTDSGGLQEEAPALKVPVFVLREVTERPEGVAAGVARLLGTNKEVIIEQVRAILTDHEHYSQMAAAENPYGDGRAAERIVERLAAD